MTDPLIIKVALNEWVDKSENRFVPYGPKEIAADVIECVEAGASLVHFHARDASTGEQRRSDASLYAEAMRLIADATDAVVFPGYQGKPVEERYAHWEELAKDPTVRMEAGPVDIGSFNLTTYDELRAGRSPRLETFNNSHGEMLHVLRQIQRIGVRCTLGIREPGHLRQVLAYRDLGYLSDPLLPKFYFTDLHPYGMPTTPQGLDTYLRMLPSDVPAQWFVEAKGEAAKRMLVLAIIEGGHVRVGIGDHPRPGGREMSNADQTREIAAMARELGREVATPHQARQLMGLTSDAPA